jgi:hypothetical protein
VPSVHRLLHRQSLLARLALPPTHSDFPHASLLHAICAVAARYSAAVNVCSVAELVEKSVNAYQRNGTTTPTTPTVDNLAREKCFSERHAGYAVLEMKADDPRGLKLYEVLQTQVGANTISLTIACVEFLLLPNRKVSHPETFG